MRRFKPISQMTNKELNDWLKWAKKEEKEWEAFIIKIQEEKEERLENSKKSF